MGLFDRQILAVLTEGKSKEFGQILREAGFSHNTSKPRVLVVAKMAKNAFILILRSKDSLKPHTQPLFLSNKPLHETIVSLPS
jgi:hypothetical protein